MRLPRPLNILDSKSPYLLLGVGAVVLAALVVRTLRRARRRRTAPRNAIVLGTLRRRPAA